LISNTLLDNGTGDGNNEKYENGDRENERDRREAETKREKGPRIAGSSVETGRKGPEGGKENDGRKDALELEKL